MSSCCNKSTCPSGAGPLASAPAAPHAENHDHDHDHASLPVVLAANLGAGHGQLQLAIPDMDCPTEGRMVEKALSTLPGVQALAFDYIGRRVTIAHDNADEAGILAALAKIGMPGKLLLNEQAQAEFHAEPVWLLVLSGGLAALAEGLAFAGQGDSSLPVMLAAALSMLIAGRATVRKGWYALKTLTLNIYFLMSLAVTGAIVLGQWPEAAMVLFLFALSERLEARALARAGEAVKSLMALRPETATVQHGDDWLEMAVAQVKVGRMVRVRPSERVPLDGEIVSGYSQFNEAPITGESLPLDKGPGAAVFAGAINGGALVLMRVTATADGSVLARIIRSVRDAQAAKAPTQRFIDRFAARYTPVVVTLAVLVAVLLPLAGLASWEDALYKALVLLVIACPCALVIATPVTLVSALAAAARHGMLIKGGAALEAAARIDTVALDKTGTLTRGELALMRIHCLTTNDDAQVLAWAAALEQHSTHPVARAICRAAAGRQLDLPTLTDGVVELPGLGVTGMLAGRQLALGNRRLAASLLANDAPLAGILSPLEAAGEGYVLLLLDGVLVAVLTLNDEIRPQAAAAMAALQAQGMHLLLLSGDQPAVVARVAATLKLADAHGGLLPEDKLQRLAAAQKTGWVAMVGDGVNDAPAMAKSDLGIAMGAAGSDTALETAQVALMEDRLERLPQLFAHARRSMTVLKANIVLALGIKAVFFMLALSGVATLWMAVFADVGASLLVIMNGLRLARAKLDKT